ncbi:Coiled-coil domain containing protein 109, C-terminal [Trema orientale]|uniref:Coiled-coil domain containing protein 109, C-terminal n=1 Tax=Trema orientale TaxID=63057 RepID=A0A2P5FXS9_TREOI|nr:Coiled-coil domain containing protein 109, C-terminal [Trema orientale]
MACKKSLAQRLFNIYKFSTKSLTSCRISPSTAQNRVPRSPNRSNLAPDPGDNAVFSRFFHKRATQPAELRSLPTGENLIEKLREIGIGRDRIRLDGLTPPPSPPATASERPGLTVEEARKLLRVTQLEAVKSRLREVQKSWISYPEFIRICEEGCSDPDQAREFAKMLDDSGSVVVFGNTVLLRPEQVAKAIQELIPVPEPNPNDPRRKELEEMENQKAEIDLRAESLVRKELWFGLAYLMVQTAGFMRLTFWELSWDVMEPICFYVTSMYFMAGYAFFLRTSKEPSFEGFFQSRISAKQKRLMKLHDFDIGRYNELKKACYPYSTPYSTSSSFDKSEKVQLGVLHD